MKPLLPLITHVVTPELRALMLHIIDALVIALSAALIVYISAETFRGVDFLADHRYMTFQFWVCVAFLGSFALEAAIATDRRDFIRRRWFYIILSIPFLNIINQWHIDVPSDLTYFLRFIPLARGALAVTIVVGYLTKNRVASMFASYMVILLSIVYFGSLIFYERELGVNPMVDGYGSALWWACMDATTAGSSINPVTPAGKVCGCVIAFMGTIMFPLFTVYATDMVRRYYKKRLTIHNPIHNP